MQIIDEQFNKIKEFSGIQNLNEIADSFIKSDKQNYDLYNYVDNLTQEIDRLKDRNVKLEDKIKEQKDEIE